MNRTTIYLGGVAVDANDYTHLTERNGDYVSEQVPGLDARVSRRPILTFTLDYPFDGTYRGQIITDAGPTLREVIDAIRAGFREMYRAASHEPIPNLMNVI